MGAGRDWERLRGGISYIPLIDISFIFGILLLTGITVLGYVVWSMFPVADHVKIHSAHLRDQGTDLKRLNKSLYYNEDDLARLVNSIPPDGPAKDDVIRRLLGASKASTANAEAMVGLNRAHTAIWGGRLREIGQAQAKFWQERARELCGEQDQIPSPPNGANDGIPADELVHLADVTNYGAAVWQLYIGCQEPKTVIIPEDLLHFRTNMSDEFESDPTPGLDTIMDHVKKNLPTRRSIYIIGHTDERADNRHNDLLSYNRALYVADRIRDRIRERLRDERLVEGRDYTLYPLGMGKHQLLKRGTTESFSDWWKRCRRIEISFRSDVRGRAGARGERAALWR